MKMRILMSVMVKRANDGVEFYGELSHQVSHPLSDDAAVGSRICEMKLQG